MDIWISRCNKSVKCSYCGELITNGEPEVFGKLWRKYSKETGGEARKWTFRFHWHAKRTRDGQCCWLAQALDYLAKEVYTEARGRKSLVMSKEMREGRLSVLRRRARVMQRLREEVKGENNVEVIIHLGGQLEKLKEEILPLGGVPKSWE